MLGIKTGNAPSALRVWGEGWAHVVQEGHGVTAVDGKHQGQEGEERRLERCHIVLEVQIQDVGSDVQKLWVRIPSCGCGCSRD